jgi:hypothetical protein
MHRPRATLAGLLVACATTVVQAQPALDDMQQAVVDSLASSRRDTPPLLLEAAIRAAAIEAPDVALRYFRQLLKSIGDAGDARGELLADLGDAFPAGDLAALDRTLHSRDPAVTQVLAAMRDAAAARRRDPARLAQAAADPPASDFLLRTWFIEMAAGPRRGGVLPWRLAPSHSPLLRPRPRAPQVRVGVHCRRDVHRGGGPARRHAGPRHGDHHLPQGVREGVL